jgi:hypothetical protein
LKNSGRSWKSQTKKTAHSRQISGMKHYYSSKEKLIQEKVWMSQVVQQQ